MNKEYRELVGLQATFDNVAEYYRLVHYYRWKRLPRVEPIEILHGYDMERQEDIAVIVGSLRKAWQPALLSVWTLDEIVSAATYFQFQPGARPDEIGLEGDWLLEKTG